MTKIEFKQLTAYSLPSKTILIMGIGFDSRGLSVLTNIRKNIGIYAVIGVHNGSWRQYSSENERMFKLLSSELKSHYIENTRNNILDVVDSMAKALCELDKNDDSHFLFDVTGFSHELLLVIIGFMDSVKALKRTLFIYTDAKEYSTNYKDNKDKWLSRGFVDLRSVFGFSGVMLPSRPLHLCLMVGFEVERAAEVIRRYEPSIISIGQASKNSSISDSHYDYNCEARAKVIEMVEEFSWDYNLNHFEFSCVDARETSRALIQYLGGYPDFNTILCPMNNKVSTIGAALAAIKLQHVQVSYLQPQEYNVSGYATASGTFTLFDVSVDV